MKKLSILKISAILIFGVLSCEKKEVPSVETSAITNITGNTAICGGTITDEGSGTVVERGICWSNSNNPTIADNKTNEGGGAGTFMSNMDNLDAASTYYVVAYAKNEAGIGYGMTMSFKTKGDMPSAITKPATNVSANGATLNGVVNAKYVSTTVSFEYGSSTSYGHTATATPSPLNDSANTDVSVDLTELSGGTLYHYRVKAINSLGTTYGNDTTFSTPGQLPSATTLEASDVQGESVTLNGIVNANLLTTDVTFEYGTTTEYGNTLNASQSPITGNASTYVNTNLIDLKGGTDYHYRVVATNSLGTTNGNDVTFRTLGEAPLARTDAATKTTPFSAQLNGSVLANNLSTVVTFEYGETTDYGNTVTSTQSPVSDNVTVPVSADIMNLTMGTAYHYRIVATNSVGTTYGDDMTFIAEYAIGESFFGGIIFYIDETGQHGLVCAPTDQSTGAEWGCYMTSLTGANGLVIGTGLQNTIDIILDCPTDGIAAKICYDLVLNTYSDWFLPSRDELALMYSNLRTNGIGGFAREYYWSSSEAANDDAWAIRFSDGYTFVPNKFNEYYVRAVRAF